jgi:glutaredoxin
MGRIAIAIALALAATAASAQLYRWVDKDGKVHYSDTVPPAFARDVQKRARDTGAGDAPQGSFDAQLATKRFPVVLYTSEPCPPCKDARDLLAKRGVPFREVRVGTDETRDELKKVSGAAEVPVMTVGRDVHRGFEPVMFNDALDAAGYPKTAPPRTAQQAAKPAPKAQATAEAKPSADPPRGRYTPMAPEDAPSMDAGRGRYLPQ